MNTFSDQQQNHWRALREYIAVELTQPIGKPIAMITDVIRQRHGGVIAVLFYGSCLRQPETQVGDSVLDFYVIVDDYRIAYDKSWLSLANHVLPPNVFYVERRYGDTTFRSKYAVISLRQFEQGVTVKATSVSLWARFCQPARLTWYRDRSALEAITAACSEAVLTMLTAAAAIIRPAQIDTENAVEVWRVGFRATYRSELRPEGEDRVKQIVGHAADRYLAITPLALAVFADRKLGRVAYSWQRHRLTGKLLNVARLVKAAFTFEGGLDYLLWKVARHSGVIIVATDWQRRHPLLAAPSLAWRLYRRGAFR